jgi:ABC-type uncharacterized transport system ATPase subunit
VSVRKVKERRKNTHEPKSAIDFSTDNSNILKIKGLSQSGQKQLHLKTMTRQLKGSEKNIPEPFDFE